MTIIGIDCGLDGGIFVLCDGEVNCYVTPTIGTTKREYDIATCMRIVRGHIPAGTYVFIEQAQPMPKQGVSSMFKIGMGYAMWQTIMVCHSVPFEIVNPRVWQREMFAGVDKSDTKKASAIVAQRLFPTTEFRKTERCKNAHSGLTDAACIAAYGARRMRAKE